VFGLVAVQDNDARDLRPGPSLGPLIDPAWAAIRAESFDWRRASRSRAL